MKHSLAITFVISFNISFCQTGTIRGVVINRDSLDIKEPVFVELKRDTQDVFSGYKLYRQAFLFEKLSPGFYKILIHQIGKRTEVYDSLQIRDGQATDLTVLYPQPCQFNYSKDYTPKCPFGHTDNIIPIVYGLPTKKLMKESKKGKIFLGGCIITDCDPRFYCRLHKKEI